MGLFSLAGGALNLTDTFLKIHLEHAHKPDSDSFNLCMAASEIQVGFLPIALDLPMDHAPRHPLFPEHTRQGIRGFSPLAARIYALFSGPAEGLCENGCAA